MRLRQLVPRDPLARMLLPILFTIIVILGGEAVSLATWGTPGWGAPNPLPRLVSGDQVVSDLAMSPSGFGFAAWNQRIGDGYRLYVNQFLPDSGWTAGTPVDTGIGQGGGKIATLAVNAAGDALVVWKEGWIPSTLFANRLVQGRGWGSPTLLGTDSQGMIQDVYPALGDTGNGMVVWSQDDLDPVWGNHTGRIYAARLDATDGWTPPATVSAGWVTGLVLLPDGRAVISWALTGGMESFASAQPPGGNWSAPVILNANLSSNGYGGPQLCALGSDRVLAVWEQLATNNFSLWSSTYTSAGGWGQPTPLPPVSGSAVLGDLVCNARGDALAVWVDSNYGTRNVGAAWWAPASGWSSSFLVGTPAAAGAAWPRAALDEEGDAMVVWWQEGGGTHSFLSTLTFGSNSAPSFQLDSSGDAVGPIVAMDSRGDALVVWEQDTASGSSMWGNRYLVPGSGVLRIPVLWVTAFALGAGAASVLTARWWRRELRNPRAPEPPTQPRRRESS